MKFCLLHDWIVLSLLVAKSVAALTLSYTRKSVMAEHFPNGFSETYDKIISLKQPEVTAETMVVSVPDSLPAMETAFNIPLVSAIFPFRSCPFNYKHAM